LSPFAKQPPTPNPFSKSARYPGASDMDTPRPSLNHPRSAGDVPSLTAAHLNKPVISGRLAPDALQAPALPARRQREILRLIHEHGQMRVTELASRLNVSGYTIRRDLDGMACRGLITRTYGGAVAADGFAGRTTDVVSRTRRRRANWRPRCRRRKSGWSLRRKSDRRRRRPRNGDAAHDASLPGTTRNYAQLCMTLCKSV
jgi:hypothetical protein